MAAAAQRHGRALAPRWERRAGIVIGGIARILAMAGGLVLVALALLTVLSVAGRAMVPLGLGPIPGDFELVEAGCAFAVFAFLPWCQWTRAHATVDVFVAWASPVAKAALSLFANLLLTGAAILIAWRLQAGLADKYAYGETTFILQMPLWYAYAAALVGAWSFALVCAYTVWRSLNEVLGEGEPG